MIAMAFWWQTKHRLDMGLIVGSNKFQKFCSHTVANITMYSVKSLGI